MRVSLTRNVNASEPHTWNVNVSEPHTRNVNVSEPHSGNVNVSEAHSGNVNVSEPTVECCVEDNAHVPCWTGTCKAHNLRYTDVYTDRPYTGRPLHSLYI